jgi:hypothetical protein
MSHSRSVSRASASSARRWARLAASFLLATIHIACSGEATKPPSNVGDSSVDTRSDDEPITPRLDAPPADSSDGMDGIVACTRGEEPRPCPAVLTGCPSFTFCSARFERICACRSCMWTLDAGVCSWTVTVDNPGVNLVERTMADGGPQRLQQITPGPCADEELGFFVTQVPGTITVTLCPASCREHEDDPSITFTLNRGPCPPT